MRCVDARLHDTFMQCTWAPPLADVLHYSASNVVEIRNGLMVDFYLGLQHKQSDHL